jgi:hypothetical protein|tara:strand:+ start:555 stop:854 length:300 start_codon:yes stop_codon:yes gene_type:complete
MGAIVRAVSRVFSGPKAAPAPVAVTPQTTVAKTAKSTKSAGMGAGKTKSSYGGGTILGSAQGDETEANTNKTVLGGGTAKPTESVKKKKPLKETSGGSY